MPAVVKTMDILNKNSDQPEILLLLSNTGHHILFHNFSI